MGIAHHAGVGRAACQVFFYEIVDHEIAKFLADIQHEMRKAMLHGCHPGIVERLEVTAARFLFAGTGAGIIPGLHGDAHHFIALLVQHQGGDRTVDPAAHSHQHFPFLAHNLNLSRQIYDSFFWYLYMQINRAFHELYKSYAQEERTVFPGGWRVYLASHIFFTQLNFKL